ncbi:MAG: riboflavin synthase [Proteobacteria bacterium]|nr:riboflavin synthase [Pseudomonadota bacterium]
MFTGLIESTGKLIRRQPIDGGQRLGIACTLKQYQLGESIAVNGACLTVAAFSEDRFEADASGETLSRTNLGALTLGSDVNLERALKLGDRMGGHWVTGHIDGVGCIASSQPRGSARAVEVECDPGLLKYIVEKGSVALDGASLTVNCVSQNSFEIMLIPHTQRILKDAFFAVGRRINIEVDILGKYIEKLLSCTNPKGSAIGGAPAAISLDKLREAGF